MTRQTYIRITDATRRVVSRIPGGANALQLPTLLCAAVYLFTAGWLLLHRDMRVVRVLAVPAACFAAATVIRAGINRQRPYDAFDVPPVGSWKPGKGKSLPSRHTASAVAIAIAVAWVFPTVPVIAGMTALAVVIGALRVLSGLHYPSDAIAAAFLSALLSWIGYTI